MSSAGDIVLYAYKELGYVDVETTTSTLRTSLMSHGLDVLSRLVASWPASGMTAVNESLAFTGNIDGSTITGLATDPDIYTTKNLNVGMAVTGTGIATGTRIARIDTVSSITLNQAADADGQGVALTFSDTPIDPMIEDAVIAMLAVRLAPSCRISPSDELAQAAKRGKGQVYAYFMRAPVASFDPMLTSTSVRRIASADDVIA